MSHIDSRPCSASFPTPDVVPGLRPTDRTHRGPLTRRVGGPLAAALLLLVTGLDAQQRTRRPQRQQPQHVELGELPFKADRLQKTRSPRAFKAFSLGDIERDAGRKLDAGTMIKLPSGKEVPLSDALAEFNKLEKSLSEEGFSLRDRDKRFRMRRVERDDSELLRQRTSIVEATTVEQSLVAGKTVGRAVRGALLQSTDQLKAIASGNLVIGSKLVPSTYKKQSVDERDSWRKDIGDPDLFSVFVAANLDIDGDSTYTKISAEASAGTSIIGKELKVLAASGTFNAPAQGKQQVKLDLKLAGVSMLSLDESYDSWSKSRDWSKTIDVSGSLSFPLVLGITAKVKAGVEGTVKLGYEASVATLYASGRFDADADLDAFAEVSIAADIKIASVEAGVGGKLTILDEDLEVVGRVQANVTSNDYRDWSLDLEMYAYHDAKLLDGELYVFVDLDLPWPFNKYDHRWEIEVFEFDGVQAKGYLFNKKKSIPLFVQS